MDIETVYKCIPPFTKVYLFLFISWTSLISVGLVASQSLEMDYYKVVTEFQIWRLITWFCFWEGFSLLFLLLIIINHVCVSTIETYYKKRVHDFYYMLFFISCCHIVMGYWLDTYADMMTELMCSLMYIYCRREQEDTVQIFGVKIKTRYFPWVWIVICKISGYQIIKIVAGYTIGHLYDYLKFTTPTTFGYNFLETPAWFNWVVNKIATKLLRLRKRQPQQANEVNYHIYWVSDPSNLIDYR